MAVPSDCDHGAEYFIVSAFISFNNYYYDTNSLLRVLGSVANTPLHLNLCCGTHRADSRKSLCDTVRT
jgi:hypothetical protein